MKKEYSKLDVQEIELESEEFANLSSDEKGDNTKFWW
jgi:hypothetical protein